MLRNKLLIVAAAVFSLLGSAVAVVAFSASSTPTGSDAVEFWSKRWVACQDSAALTTDEVMADSYDCLRSLISDAVKSNSFEALVNAGTPILDNDIKLAYVCHIPGHDLGAEFVEYFEGDYSKAIMTLNANICGSGIVHGILDVWGKTTHSTGEWLQVGEACIEANKVRYNACADAVGHAAYESKGRDLAAAIGVCDAMQQDWLRNACTNGAIMQSQYPQSSALKETRSANMPQDWGDLVRFCDALPYTNPGTMDGCYGGSGWVMGNTIFHELQERATLPDEKQSTPEQDRYVVERAKYALDACEASTPGNRGNPDVCQWLMLARMPLFFYLDIPKFVTFCRDTTDGRPETLFLNCLASGQEHISPEQKQQLVDEFPEVGELMRLRNPVEADLVR